MAALAVCPSKPTSPEAAIGSAAANRLLPVTIAEAGRVRAITPGEPGNYLHWEIRMIESFAGILVGWLTLAPVLVCFVGSFVGGTVVTLVLATFAGSSDLPWWPVILGAFLGNYASDIGWFGLARSRLADRVRASRHFADRGDEIERLRNSYRKRDWLFFIAIKFAYGLRIAQILILGAAHYPWRRFLQLDAAAVAVINSAAVLSGWAFGRGATRYMDLFENTGTIISALAAALLVFVTARWLINRYMLRKR
jgi:membrane protein DedA with SNARE-associated domain